MLDYLYDVEAVQYSFIRVPKILLQHEDYQRIAPDAKLLYSLLLDRVGLSLRNGWKDKQNRVYIIYPIAEIMEEMNCGKNKAVQLLDELEQKAGLIERKRQGLGKPNLIYVKNLFRTVDNFGVTHFLKFENKTSGGPKTKPQEVSESNPNNTDTNKTYKNHTDLSFLPEREPKRSDGYAQYKSYFNSELEMPILIQNYPTEKETLEGILDLLAETCSSKRKAIRIAGDDKPVEVVKSRLMKLNSMDDDVAKILVVDSNLQRENILPSERAFAYKMKADAMKHQGARSDLWTEGTSRQVGTKLRTDEQIAETVGDSARNIQRFIRLTNLIPELLEMLDPVSSNNCLRPLK